MNSAPNYRIGKFPLAPIVVQTVNHRSFANVSTNSFLALIPMTKTASYGGTIPIG